MDQTFFLCELVWEYLIGRGQSGVFSGKQLARKIWYLKFNPDIRKRILAELEPSKWAAKTVDEAVERVAWNLTGHGQVSSCQESFGPFQMCATIF